MCRTHASEVASFSDSRRRSVWFHRQCHRFRQYSHAGGVFGRLTGQPAVVRNEDRLTPIRSCRGHQHHRHYENPDAGAAFRRCSGIAGISNVSGADLCRTCVLIDPAGGACTGMELSLALRPDRKGHAPVEIQEAWPFPGGSSVEVFAAEGAEARIDPAAVP